MARTDIPAAHSPWWRSAFRVQWLVPLAAAAAITIAVWVSLRPANQPANVLVLDRSEATRPAEPVAESKTAPPAPGPVSEAASGQAKPSTRQARQKAAESKPKEELTDKSTVRERATTLDALANRATEPQRRIEPPAAPAPPASPPPAQSAPLPAASAGRSGGGARSQADSPAIGALAETATFRASGSAAFTTQQIVSPDPAFRWRPRADGAVERSVDGGRTWELQQTGSPAVLTAGSSPSPAVCWLVGRAGVVLRSTDARTWQRLPFPESADLSAVRASDAATATITTADARTFSTKDGGVTWVRIPNP